MAKKARGFEAERGEMGRGREGDQVGSTEATSRISDARVWRRGRNLGHVNAPLGIERRAVRGLMRLLRASFRRRRGVSVGYGRWVGSRWVRDDRRVRVVVRLSDIRSGTVSEWDNEGFIVGSIRGFKLVNVDGLRVEMVV